MMINGQTCGRLDGGKDFGWIPLAGPTFGRIKEPHGSEHDVESRTKSSVLVFVFLLLSLFNTHHVVASRDTSTFRS